MIVYGVSGDEILRFAHDCGFTVYNMRPQGKGMAFVLRPWKGSDTYRATGSHGRKWAVCYHGHYAFMSRMFDAYPNARLKSALATFNGQDDFHALAGIVGLKNVGSQVQPRRFEDSCCCEIARIAYV